MMAGEFLGINQSMPTLQIKENEAQRDCLQSSTVREGLGVQAEITLTPQSQSRVADPRISLRATGTPAQSVGRNPR